MYQYSSFQDFTAHTISSNNLFTHKRKIPKFARSYKKKQKKKTINHKIMLYSDIMVFKNDNGINLMSFRLKYYPEKITAKLAMKIC